MNSDIRNEMQVTLGENLAEVKQRLKDDIHRQKVYCFHEWKADPELLLLFMEYITELQKYSIKKRQRDGIDIALQKKQAGVGSYGRPETKLPVDFDERVRQCMEGKQSLLSYCKEIGMKQSTFYKHARQSMDRINRDCRRNSQ